MPLKFVLRGSSLALVSLVLFSCADVDRRSASMNVESVARGSDVGSQREALLDRYEELADSILAARAEEVAIVREIVAATYKDAQAAHAEALRALEANDSEAARKAGEDLATLVASMATEGDASVARIRKRLVEGGHHYNSLPPLGVGAMDAGGAPPAHHGDGSSPGHHAGEKPGSHAPESGAGAHAANRDAGGHHAGDAPAGHAANERPGAHHADGSSADSKAGHHADSPSSHHGNPAHHRDGTADGGVALDGFDPGFVVVDRRRKKALLDISRTLARAAPSLNEEVLADEWARVEAIWADIEGRTK